VSDVILIFLVGLCVNRGVKLGLIPAAEAIAEAVGRPAMRFVPIKGDDQLDLQFLHRLRKR
jgi:hypothetical protein